LDKFDELLLRTVDYVIESIFGKMNANIIYNHLEKKGCPRHEIPRKPEVFSMVLRNILGCGRGQILGTASILEEAILKAFCIQLRIEFTEGNSASFADCIKSLMEVYENEKALQSNLPSRAIP